MWGFSMGTLRLQVSTNWGTSWSTIWSRAGDQGNQWLTATVNINNFINVDGVQFRFQGITTNGFGGDMAVDNVRFVNSEVCTSFFAANASFENTLNGWTQNTNDDFDWSFRTGGTPSSNTGPAAAQAGNTYLYTEASNNFNSQAILTSPCYNMSSVSTPVVTFWVHRYGSDMGNLQLQASTNNGASWTTHWSSTGDFGGSWEYISLFLTEYGNRSNVRFRFVGTTGSSFRSDMAIDNFNLSIGISLRNDADDNNTTTPTPLTLATEAPFLTVAPNPFTNHVRLETNLAGEPNYRLVNLQGQILKEGQLRGDQLHLPLPELAAGVYFITVYNEEEQLVRKIVRQ